MIYWLKIRILEATPVLSADPSHINSAEVAVSDMVCRLPLNQSSDSSCRWSTHAESWCMPCTPCMAPNLVSKFNTEISMISTRYETCDWLPIRSNGVFFPYVAEHIGLISARSSGRSHLIHLQNKNRYKLVINWCPRSPTRSVFGATSTTTQIFRNSHEPKTPVHARVEFTIHFMGRLSY